MSTRAVYRSELRNFVSEKEQEEIKRLCDASETNGKLFGNLQNRTVHHHK